MPRFLRLARSRVLLVDALSSSAVQLTAVLRARGLRVVAMATNAAEAVSQLHARRPHLAVVNVATLGADLAEPVLRALQGERNVPAIAVIRHNDLVARDRLAGLAGVEVVSDPLTEHELERATRRLLRHR